MLSTGFISLSASIINKHLLIITIQGETFYFDFR